MEMVNNNYSFQSHEVMVSCCRHMARISLRDDDFLGDSLILLSIIHQMLKIIIRKFSKFFYFGVCLLFFKLGKNFEKIFFFNIFFQTSAIRI